MESNIELKIKYLELLFQTFINKSLERSLFSLWSKVNKRGVKKL